MVLEADWPCLGRVPDGARVLAILLYQWQNARRHDSVRFAKVVVDFCTRLWSADSLHSPGVFNCDVPCSVSVMDCSNFSSSSVSDRLRAATLGRAIVQAGSKGSSLVCRFENVVGKRV